jgi:Tol biopolymer transport system component
VTSEAGSIDVWISDLARGALSRLNSQGVNYQPAWSPDGNRVAFYSAHRAARGIYWAPADGSGKEELLVAGSSIFPDSWTPDGKTLLYESTAPARIWMVSVSALAGDSKPRMLSEPSPSNEAQAQVSPDGRWMAYVSDESGKSQVYARPFPGPGSKVPISIEAGDTPRWSASGREIFYFDPNKNQVMAVAIEGGAVLHPGQPHALFTQPTHDLGRYA